MIEILSLGTRFTSRMPGGGEEPFYCLEARINGERLYVAEWTPAIAFLMIVGELAAAALEVGGNDGLY